MPRIPRDVLHSVGFQSVLTQGVTLLQVKGFKQGFCQTSLPVPHFYSPEAFVDRIIPCLSLNALSKFAEFYIIIQLANENIELYQPQYEPSRSYRGFTLKFDMLRFLKFEI